MQHLAHIAHTYAERCTPLCNLDFFSVCEVGKCVSPPSRCPFKSFNTTAHIRNYWDCVSGTTQRLKEGERLKNTATLSNPPLEKRWDRSSFWGSSGSAFRVSSQRDLPGDALERATQEASWSDARTASKYFLWCIGEAAPFPGLTHMVDLLTQSLEESQELIVTDIDPYLMTKRKGRNVDGPLNWELLFLRFLVSGLSGTRMTTEQKAKARYRALKPDNPPLQKTITWLHFYSSIKQDCDKRQSSSRICSTLCWEEG